MTKNNQGSNLPTLVGAIVLEPVVVKALKLYLLNYDTCKTQENYTHWINQYLSLVVGGLKLDKALLEKLLVEFSPIEVDNFINAISEIWKSKIKGTDAAGFTLRDIEEVMHEILKLSFEDKDGIKSRQPKTVEYYCDLLRSIPSDALIEFIISNYKKRQQENIALLRRAIEANTYIQDHPKILHQLTSKVPLKPKKN